MVETLVVIVIFAMLSAIIAQSVALSLRGARKSDSLSDVREDLDFTISILERNVRGAIAVNSACNGSTLTSFSYNNEDETSSVISCQNIGPNGYISLDGERLTGSDLSITACQFSCEQPASSVPPVIHISISGSKKNAASTEVSNITVDSQVRLRIY